MKSFNINPLFFIVVSIAYLSGNIYSFTVTFLSLVIHELIHLLLLSKKHVVIEKISVEPFGICIKSKNPENIAPIVFIGAPIFNLIIGFMFLYFSRIFYKEAFFFIYEVNLSLGLFNLLPILPFDGGRFILVSFLKKDKNIKKVMTFSSITLGIVITILGAMFLKITNYNFSVCLIGIFIIFNAVCENETNNFKKSKKIIQKSNTITQKTSTKIVSVPYDYPAHKLISEFLSNEYYIVNIIKNGKIFNTVTENQIINCVVNSDKNLKIYEINWHILIFF